VKLMTSGASPKTAAAFGHAIEKRVGVWIPDSREDACSGTARYCSAEKAYLLNH
jgi:hypothetical protein